VPDTKTNVKSFCQRRRILPNHDGSGPNKKGPISGRGSGYCVIPINTAEEEIGFLKNQEQSLKQRLKHIQIRIKHIEEKSTKRS
jgi:hypothetical protein